MSLKSILDKTVINKFYDILETEVGHERFLRAKTAEELDVFEIVEFAQEAAKTYGLISFKIQPNKDWLIIDINTGKNEIKGVEA